MKRYFTMSLTLFMFSVLNAVTYLLLGIITGNTAFSGIFSITYPLQFVSAVLLSFFASASNIRANREDNKNCVSTGMILGLIAGGLIFGIVAIFIDNYINFMNMDPELFRDFALMAVGQLFLAYVNNLVSEKLYFEGKDKLGNICNLGFIVLNLVTVVVPALITTNQIIVVLVNIFALLIYVAIWFGFNIKKFKFDFKIFKNFKLESLTIIGDIFMLLIYLFGFSKAFSFGEEYFVAINFVNLVTDPQWDALSAINKIAKIDISKSCYNYKSAIKRSAAITAFYIAICIILFFSLFKVYDVVLEIGIIYLTIQIADYIVNTEKSNVQTFLQLEYSPTKATLRNLTCKAIRTVMSIFIISPFNTNIAQISCGVLGLIIFEIFRFRNFKLDKEGTLQRKIVTKENKM